MRFAVVIALLIIGPTANALQMFENAVRRAEKSDREARPIVKVMTESKPGKFGRCTGFFVKNAEERPYIATARHCAKFQITKFCEAGKITVITEFGKHKGTCKKVVAALESQDLAIIEVDFANWSKLSTEVHFLRMSKQRPRHGTKLKMIGYPGDEYRKGKFTVTESCWIHNGRMVLMSDYTAADIEKNRAKRSKMVKTPEQRARASKIRDKRVAFHNCSVYGGNSGGPILIHGTPIVLGLPTAYYPGALTKQPSELSTSMDSTATFYERNRAAIDAAGIEFVSPYNSVE